MSTNQPLYGGWRRSRRMGFGNLDARNTLLVIAAAVILLLGSVVWGLGALPWSLPVAAVLVVLALTQVRGVWVVDLIVAALGYARARMGGRTSYRAHLWAPNPRRWDLPGVLAPTRLLDYRDPARHSVGLVWNPRGLMSATYLLSPTGALLADQGTVDQQVRAWGDVLASLADDPAVDHAAVTIETVPAAGTDLARHVQGRIDPDAPDLARQMMEEVLGAAPTNTARLRARMTLTVDTRAAGARTLEAAVVETLRSLGGLSLTAAGVDVLRRASTPDLVQMVRAAFNPAVEQDTDPAAWEQLTWPDAGPVCAEETWAQYRHDDAYSATWCLVQAPHQMVPHDVLLPLLLPTPYMRRLTVLYRTLPREEAGRLLEREQTAAATRRAWNAYQGKDSTAREQADSQRATKAAQEEAYGAGITEFTLLVTATCASPEELKEAERHTMQAASRARLRMRPAWGGQAAAFAIGLGVAGLYPPDL